MCFFFLFFEFFLNLIFILFIFFEKLQVFKLNPNKYIPNIFLKLYLFISLTILYLFRYCF